MGVDAAAEEQFGPYLVYERLGVGGMATVHRALERGGDGFERVVALKRLLPHLAEDASFIKSFVREAKLASLLNHINIVQIHELGRVGTEYFISMEYIDGHDIRQVLRHARKVTGPPPVHFTVGVMLQLADALDYAHGKTDDTGQPLGIVHRDVSPSNLLLTSAGHLKVIDFGIAKAQTSQLRTQTGRVKGKLAYMAPEVIHNRDLDARSDLWAAGVILHELLTARPLFASKNEYQTLMKVQRGDILPPSSFNPKCPPELDAIALKALARDPDERYRNAAELRAALGGVRKRYMLQTGYRDVAGWVEWAFSVDPTVADPSPRETPPRGARRSDEDEAVELVWGAAEEAGPVLLDEVPDVSEKHVAAQRSDTEQEDEDAPTPWPRGPWGGHVGVKTEPGVGSEIEAGPPTDPEPIRATRATGPQTPIPVRATRLTGPQAPLAARPRMRARETVPPPEPAPAKVVPHEPDTDPARRVSTEDILDVDPAETLPSAPPPGQTLPRFSRASSASVGTDPVQRPSDLSTTLPRPRASDPALAPASNPRKLPLAPPQRPSDPADGVLRTKPGMAVARQGLPPRDPVADAALDGLRRKHDASFTIGAAIASRKPARRTWPIVAGCLLAGACAMIATLYATRRTTAPSDVVKPATEPGKAASTTGTVKFIVEPTDAEVRIEGAPPHTGSPWTTELAEGVHQIEIHRAGYKAWVTSLELSAREQASLRVVLVPLGGQAQTSDATLSVTTTPAGLEVMLDDQPLPQHTPIRMPIQPGPHVVAVRQNGAEVWRQGLDAAPNSVYELTPSFSADKQRERAERGGPNDVGHPATSHAAPAPEAATDSEPAAGASVPPPPAAADPEPAHVPAPAPAPSPPPAPPSAPAAIATPRPSPPPPPPPPGTPAVVRPNAVTKLSGDTPNISSRGDVPPVVAAKVCIDVSGRVSSVEMLTKLEHHAAEDLTDAIKTWRYAPYRDGASVIPACFSLTLRTK